jgi:hypothetical protein
MSRNKTGSLGLGVAAMVLLLLCILSGLWLVANVATSAYYQGKLNYIADQAAHFGAARYSWYEDVTPGGLSAAQTSTQTIVNSMLSDIGLPRGTVTLSISPDNNHMQSQLQVSGLVLPGNGNWGSIINLQAGGVADMDADLPPALLTFQFAGDTQSVVCPSWGWYMDPYTHYGSPPVPDICVFRPINTPLFAMGGELPNGCTLTLGPNTPKAWGVP